MKKDFKLYLMISAYMAVVANLVLSVAIYETFEKSTSCSYLETTRSYSFASLTKGLSYPEHVRKCSNSKELVKQFNFDVKMELRIEEQDPNSDYERICAELIKKMEGTNG